MCETISINKPPSAAGFTLTNVTNPLDFNRDGTKKKHKDQKGLIKGGLENEGAGVT